MKSRRVVEVEVGIYAGFQVFHCFIAFKVDVLVLETSPKTLNSDVIQSPLFSVHADLDVVIDKNFYKNIRCKLASLVCVEDCRTAVFFDCFPQKICTDEKCSGLCKLNLFDPRRRLYSVKLPVLFLSNQAQLSVLQLS